MLRGSDVAGEGSFPDAVRSGKKDRLRQAVASQHPLDAFHDPRVADEVGERHYSIPSLCDTWVQISADTSSIEPAASIRTTRSGSAAAMDW